MKTGGYQIIDLQNQPLSDSAVNIPGTYDLIESTRKAILLSGINIGGVEYHDTFIEVSVDSGNYTTTVYGKTLTITSDDNITIGG